MSACGFGVSAHKSECVWRPEVNSGCCASNAVSSEPQDYPAPILIFGIAGNIPCLAFFTKNSNSDPPSCGTGFIRRAAFPGLGVIHYVLGSLLYLSPLF